MTTSPAAAPVAFMVVSCDRYADLWDPFFHSLRKYWPDCPYPVYLVTNYKSYDAPGVTVIKVGDDQSYSDNLSAAIKEISEPWVILWLEDIFISAPVDTKRFEGIIAQACAIPVGYLKVSPDLPLSYAKGQEIGPIPKGVRYRSAIGLSLYKVETLKKLLIPGASAWDLDQSTMSNELDDPFYALTSKEVRNPPITFINAVIKGKWNWPVIPFLKKEGFSRLIKDRSRLSAKGYLYIKFFLLHNFIFRTLKRHWR